MQPGKARAAAVACQHEVNELRLRKDLAAVLWRGPRRSCRALPPYVHPLLQTRK